MYILKHRYHEHSLYQISFCSKMGHFWPIEFLPLQAFSYLIQSVLNNLQILNSIVDPLVQMCSVSASRLNTADMATYMINCIYLIQNNLALYEFTDTRLEMLQAQVLVFTNNYYHYLRVVMRALINI